MVYERASGLTAADRAKAAADARRFAELPASCPARWWARSRRPTARPSQTILQVNLGTQGWNGAAKAADSIRAITSSNANGLASHITGPLGNAADSSKVFKGIDSTLLYSALAVVIVILLITYRSPVLWLLPVISSGVALITAQAVIYLLAAHAGLTVNAQSAGILDVLVFGASTDYALLLVARYREELRRHDRRHAAMAEALRRAGPAIIASGATVIVALLTLFAARAELDEEPGAGARDRRRRSACSSMLTLLPALLVICPRGVFWPYRPTYGSAEPTTRGLWARVGWSIATRAAAGTWITTAVILGVLALGLTGLKANGLTNAQAFRGHPDSVIGATVLAQHFPAGAGEPVIVDRQPERGGPAAVRLRRNPGIASVTPPVVRAGHAYLEGTLTSPPDSQAAYATIDRVRSAVHAVPGADAQVGGTTAINLDVAARVRARPQRHHPAHPRRGVRHPRAAAAGAGGAADPDRHGGALVRRRPRRQRLLLQPRVRVRRRRYRLPAVRVRVPGRARHRLQHLPDDPGAGGGDQARRPARRARRAGRDRRGDHLGRASCSPARSPSSPRSRRRS